MARGLTSGLLSLQSQPTVAPGAHATTPSMSLSPQASSTSPSQSSSTPFWHWKPAPGKIMSFESSQSLARISGHR